jgi:hypothetical protein
VLAGMLYNIPNGMLANFGFICNLDTYVNSILAVFESFKDAMGCWPDLVNK